MAMTGRHAYQRFQSRGTLLPLAVVLLLLVVSVIGLALRVSGSSSGNGTSDAALQRLPKAPANLDGVASSYSGEGWTAIASGDLAASASDAVLAIQWRGPSGDGNPYQVRLLSSTSGDEVGRVLTSWGQMATIRRSAGELLISDVVPVDGGRGKRVRLLVFDLNGGLQLKRELELKNRLEYTIFSQRIHLSPDETVLYYETHDYVAELWDVGIVRLDSPAASIADVTFPKTCFFPTMDVTAAGATVACRNGDIYLATPSGAVTHIGVGPGAARDPRVPIPPISKELSAAWTRADGAVIALRMDGELVLIERGQTRSFGRAFPASNEVWISGLGRLGETAVIAYRRPIAQEASAVVLLDLSTGRARELPNTANSRFVIRVRGGTLVQQQPAGLRLVEDGGAQRVLTGLFGDDQAGWAIAW